MSKIFIRVLESASQDLTPKSAYYLADIMKGKVSVEVLNLHKLTIGNLADKLWELGHYDATLAILEILNQKLGHDRYAMLAFSDALNRISEYEKAIEIITDLYENSSNLMEEIKALDMMMQVQSKRIGSWFERKKVLHDLRINLEKIFRSGFDLQEEDLMIIMTCSYWFSGYFSDDLNDLEFSQEVAKFFRQKMTEIPLRGHWQS